MQDEELNKKIDEESTLNEALDTQVADTYSDDVQFESEDESENIAGTLKKLREKLRTCEQEKKDNLDGWQRMRADFANARKDEETRR